MTLFKNPFWFSLLLFSLLMLAMVADREARAGSLADQQATVARAFSEYKAGDLLQLPVRKGNFVLLLCGQQGVKLWYDGEKEFFSFMPIRNYGTLYIDITRKIPELDCQFMEIAANEDPTKLENWLYARISNVRIVTCDDFSIMTPGPGTCERETYR